ncbi:hypothetical protein LCGC14_1184970 [marine sediment metagenome]|uniref:4Fe-4S ferredoxin-type domain-containing protein n=1 Tax=marine sediment metagenome TaxID=412755 RepID=A0A0F9LL52_9ZZZZ
MTGSPAPHPIELKLPGKARPGASQAAPKSPWRVDLFRRVPGLRWLVTRRWFQFAVIFPNLAVFYFFLIAGVFGSPVGSRNIIIVFVWILWWFVLIAVMVPFASRVWCTVCPFPFFGEWFQRRRLIGVATGKPAVGRNRMAGLRRRWPKVFRNIWLQNLGFLALCTFSAMLVTRPIVSVIVLGGLFVVATITHVIFRQRSFCMYLCPVSGFLSLYSMTSMLALRSKSKDVCGECKQKACLTGNEDGWGCPWFQHVQKLDRNNYCGLCMECVKSCPHDNVTLYARPFASDTLLKGYDEVWKAFIMLTLAMAYSVVLLGPWGVLKNWANISEVGDWVGFLTYAGSLWFVALVGLPLIYYAAIRAGRWLAGSEAVTTKDMFVQYGYTLVPLGLFAWIAFSIPLVMINGSYIVSIISDPLGWGWDIFGTADVHWTPILPEYATWFQIPVLALGLYWAIKKGFEIAVRMHGTVRQAGRSILPLCVLLLLVTTVFIVLFVG